MSWPGLIGGTVGYRILRAIRPYGRSRRGDADAEPYRDRSKLETLFGPGIWSEVRGKDVVDFGCGVGDEAVEMARHGARRVTGTDIREEVLALARAAAASAGVSDRCLFTTRVDEPADVVVSVDGFEHYDDPGQVLRLMRRLLRPGGRILVCFGPPWLHPLGGHLFSVFPWAHLVFSERALIRWRSEFKSDGATRFCEVAGGLNRMTVRRSRKLVDESEFEVERFEAVPIRRLRHLWNPMTREFLTSVVRCTLVPRASSRDERPCAA
jgi:SAM-dependent methyltransferase